MNKGLYGISKNRTYDTKYHTLVESASYATTASYINPTFISASAAASGFGNGGSINPTSGFIPYNNSSVFDDTNIYFNGAYIGIGTSLPTYELHVVGNINFTGDLYKSGSLFGSGVGAIQSTGSTLYSSTPLAGPNVSTNNGIFLGDAAGQNSIGADSSNFIGLYSGQGAAQSYSSNFIGPFSGQSAVSASNSNFIGSSAGYNATNPTGNSNYIRNSNYIGLAAGINTSFIDTVNFIGAYAGQNVVASQYSTLIGYQAGKANSSRTNSIGNNNIIIGTNITLPSGTSNGINLGGLIFASGAYSNAAGEPSSGSANGRVGINIVSPRYTLDVSGSGNYTNGLIVTGSFTVVTGSSVELQVTNTGVRMGNVITDTHSITGSLSISGSIVGYVQNSQTSSFVQNSQTSSMTVATSSWSSFPMSNLSTNLYSTAPASSVPSNSNNTNNIWLGTSAGFNSASSSFSIFLGNSAGFASTGGGSINRSSYCLMIGNNAGLNAVSASHSTLIGRSVGGGAAGGVQSIGENNIIIGTFITLEAGRRDSINLGGVIFATGSYYSTTTRTSGSVGNARVGINVSNPQYSLDVSGSGNYTNGLTITGSVSASSFLSVGTNTFAKSPNVGDIAIDNGTTDTPGLLMYYASASNWGIDSNNQSFDVLSPGQLFRVVNKLNETGGAVKMAIDTSGNAVFTGYVKPSAWRAGQVIQTLVLGKDDVTQLTQGGLNRMATDQYNRDVFYYNSYTPLSNSSYIFVEVYLSKYDGGGAGSGTDTWYSQLKATLASTYERNANGENIGTGNTEIGYQWQGTRTSDSFRTGTLFPLSGRYTNSDTNAKVFSVSVRRDSADDYITYDWASASFWMKITEVAR